MRLICQLMFGDSRLKGKLSTSGHYSLPAANELDTSGTTLDFVIACKWYKLMDCTPTDVHAVVVILNRIYTWFLSLFSWYQSFTFDSCPIFLFTDWNSSCDENGIHKLYSDCSGTRQLAGSLILFHYFVDNYFNITLACNLSHNTKLIARALLLLNAARVQITGNLQVIGNSTYLRSGY